MNQSETEIEILAEKIARWARARSAEIERDRRLPDELVTRLREAGLLRATMPREVAAPELAPGRALRCAEAVARGDASAGWCVSIAITSALLVAYLPARSREEMFGGGRGVAAGVWAPRGTARSVDGGVVVSGRWPFCSGINHADIMFAGCFVDDRQVPSVVALNKDELQVLDTWHTLGLRGTGSHDCVATTSSCPLIACSRCLTDQSWTGRCIAFRCLDFSRCRLARLRWAMRAPRLTIWSSWPAARKGLGPLGPWRNVRRPKPRRQPPSRRWAPPALFYEVIEAAWQVSHDAEAVPVTMRNRLRLAATHAVRTSADVVRSMYDLAGGTAIYDNAPLQRRFRDAFTATAHFQVNEASRELPGRVLLDQPADVSML